jgi:hypothetical protein
MAAGLTYEQLWWRAFWLTQAIEVPIYTLLLTLLPARPLWRRPDPAAPPLGLELRLLVAFAASSLTHPWVWYVFPPLIDDYWPMVAVAETFAVVVEACWMHFSGLRYALACSLLANGVSATIGFLRHS